MSLNNKLTFPSISPKHSAPLGRKILNAEILEAIKSLKSNKTPGADDFSSGFYKKFAP